MDGVRRDDPGERPRAGGSLRIAHRASRIEQAQRHGDIDATADPNALALLARLRGLESLAAHTLRVAPEVVRR